MAAVVGCGSEFTTDTSSSSGSGGSDGGTTASSTGDGGTTASSTGSAGSGGATTTPPTGGSGGCSAPGGDPCNTCIFNHCQGSYCDCQQMPDCWEIMTCVNGCATADKACLGSCFTGHGGGISQFALLYNCGAIASQCQGCGFEQLSPCEMCLFQSCTSQVNQCYSDPNCRAILNCMLDCQSGPGFEQCILNCGSHPDMPPLQECASTTCQTDCPQLPPPL